MALDGSCSGFLWTVRVVYGFYRGSLKIVQRFSYACRICVIQVMQPCPLYADNLFISSCFDSPSQPLQLAYLFSLLTQLYFSILLTHLSVTQKVSLLNSFFLDFALKSICLIVVPTSKCLLNAAKRPERFGYDSNVFLCHSLLLPLPNLS